MCVVSDKLRLCTCTNSDLDALDHYWVYYRFDANQADFIVGEPMLPHWLDAFTNKLNYTTLLHLLNDGNPFDTDVSPNKGDRLLLSFTCTEPNQRLYYGFEYNGNKWRKKDFDAIEWLWHHAQSNQGKVLHALKR